MESLKEAVRLLGTPKRPDSGDAWKEEDMERNMQSEWGVTLGPLSEGSDSDSASIQEAGWTLSTKGSPFLTGMYRPLLCAAEGLQALI